MQNETINLAYGQGNTLVRAAELIARELGVSPQIAQAPSLVGEVTHYVADIRKARELLGWEPQDAARRRDPARVEWFRSLARSASRRGHATLVAEREPRRDRAGVQAGRRLGCLSPRVVVAIFGPTACGKSAVAARARRAPRRRGRLRRLGGALRRGSPLLTAAPRLRRRGSSAIVPLDRDVSVGEYQRLAHAAIDEILAAGRTPIVAGGTGLYLRAALSRARAAAAAARPGRASGSERLYDELGAEGAHALLAARDPAAAARVHPNDRRRVVRALELAEAGRLARPRRGSPLERGDAPPDARSSASSSPPASSSARIEARLEAMVAARRRRGGARGLGGPLSETAREVLGLEQFATLPPAEAAAAVVAATLRLARYQRKWLRRLPVAATLDADRPPEEIADEIVALAGAGERLPRR